MSIKKELPLFGDTDHMIGALLARIDMAPNDDPIPYIREYVEGLRGRHLLSMSAAVPVEERTRVLMEALRAVETERLEVHEEALAKYTETKEWDADVAYTRAIRDAENAIKALITRPIPEERTAEMDELMASLRAAAEEATPGKWSKWWFYSIFRYFRKNCGWWDDYEMLAPDGVFARDEDCDADYIAAASPENILKLLDHIEGKGK